MTLILRSLDEPSSQHLCLIPEKILQTLQNFMFYEVSESKKLHHALTNVCLDTSEQEFLHKLGFTLDTRASGNLLPVSVYHVNYFLIIT